MNASKKDRTDYINMRNSKNYDLNWFYRHYLRNSNNSIDIGTFSMVFNSVELNNILQHLDREFELNLTDKQGIFYDTDS